MVARGLEKWKMEMIANGYRSSSGRMRMFQNWIAVGVAGLSQHTKNREIVHFKMMNCMLHEKCLYIYIYMHRNN